MMEFVLAAFVVFLVLLAARGQIPLRLRQGAFRAQTKLPGPEGVVVGSAGTTAAGHLLEVVRTMEDDGNRAYAERNKRAGDSPSARFYLRCTLTDAPQAAIRGLSHPLHTRLTTGEPRFDEVVDLLPAVRLPWLLALDPQGREALRTAVAQGWVCKGDEWLLKLDGPFWEEADPATVQAIDPVAAALVPSRCDGEARWEERIQSKDRSRMRALLALEGASAGWLTAEEAHNALQTETDPLLRLALFTLFLPDSEAEVIAALDHHDPEVTGMAAVALAKLEPRGDLRAKVEAELLQHLDLPLDGGLEALEVVAGPLGMQALGERLGAGGRWPAARRTVGRDMLSRLRRRAVERGGGAGGLMLAEEGGGAVSLAEVDDDSPER